MSAHAQTGAGTKLGANLSISPAAGPYLCSPPTPRPQATMWSIHARREVAVPRMWLAPHRPLIHPLQTQLTDWPTPATDPSTAEPSEGKPRTHLLTSKGMVEAGRSEGGGRRTRLQTARICSSTLPLVHRYRVDVSLGRFAQAHWRRATSCSMILLPARTVRRFYDFFFLTRVKKTISCQT